MSSISGVGGLNAETLQSLLQAQKQNEANGAGRPPPAGEAGPPQLWAEIEESAETAGLTAEQVDELKSSLKEAISTAMESVDRSEGPKAAHEAIDSAILSTLQGYGIDTTDIESRMEEAKSRMQSHGPPQGAPPSGGPPSGGPPAGGPPAGGAEPGNTTDVGSSLLALIGAEQDDVSSFLSALFPLVDEEA